jgi:hypothetical protein
MDSDIVSVVYKSDVKHNSFLNDFTPMHVSIYMISCKDYTVDDVYVGQTRKFENRKMYHERDSQTSSLKLYECIRTHGGWDNWDMIVLSEYTCNFIESLQIEWFWWNKLGATLNTVVPGHKHISDKIVKIESVCRRW